MRAILLLEVDFNGLNKIIYNRRVLPKLEANRVIPYEVISGKKVQYSQHIDLNKKLVCDIANQTKRLTVVILANATNYSNHITHPVASLSN